MRYRTIVADPPWAYPEGFGERAEVPHKQDRERGMTSNKFIRRDLPYSSMAIPEIAALPIADLAEPDARLFLWTTSRYLFHAFEVMRAWGFQYRQTMVWDKRPNVNPVAGGVAAIASEFLLVGARGTPGMLKRWPTSIVTARKARSTHSVKPDVFLDIVEQISPGPYLEMFARRDRLGWDSWGDEALGTAELTRVAFDEDSR